MSPLAFYRDLVANGLPEHLAYQIAEKFEADRDAELRATYEGMLATVAKPIDTAAEKRRAWDRERKRRSGGIPVESGGTQVESGGAPPLPLPSSPQTPQQPTPTPPDINTRARADASFARFWLAYPRKTAKGDARKAFDKAIRKLRLDPNNDPERVLIGALERAKAAWVDAQFIPHPATWLNGERWEDEPETATPRKAHGKSSADAKFDACQANYDRAWAGSEQALGRCREP